MVYMETLQLLGTTMGLSALAGLNLYLTVFVAGLAIQMGWVQLAPGLEKLAVLGDPVVLAVAGVLLVVELVVDKVAYADSGWDTLHTIIRPVGGAIIGLKALGTMDPSLDVMGALLGGTVAFTTHAAKSGARLLVNTSPEPASNIVVSAGENVFVVGGLWFVFQHPLMSLLIVGVFLAVFWYCAPKFFRMIKAYWLGLAQRFATRRGANEEPFPPTVPAFARETWLTLQREDEDVTWVLPAISGKIPTLGRNLRGCVIGTTEGRLLFIGRKNFRARFCTVPLQNSRVTTSGGTVFHRLIVRTEEDALYRLRFTRQYAAYLPRVIAWAGPHRAPATRTLAVAEHAV